VPKYNKKNNPNYNFYKLNKYIKLNRLKRTFRKSKEAVANNNNSKSEQCNSKPNVFEKYGTWTDRIGTLAAIIAIGFTVALFYQTKTATKAATDSAAEAKRANDQTRENDRLNRISELRKDSEDSIDRNITLASIKSSDSISKATLQQQINSFNQTKLDFEIENRPFTAIGDFTPPIFDSIAPNNFSIFINFRIVNFGKLPAKLTKIVFNNRIMPKGLTKQQVIDSVNSFTIFNRMEPNVTIGNVIAGGYPITGIVSGLWKNTIDRLKTGEDLYYIYGTTYYSNPITTKKYISKYIYRINLITGGTDIFRNEDYETN
jgi:hypothetical protein